MSWNNIRLLAMDAYPSTPGSAASSQFKQGARVRFEGHREITGHGTVHSVKPSGVFNTKEYPKHWFVPAGKSDTSYHKSGAIARIHNDKATDAKIAAHGKGMSSSQQSSMLGGGWQSKATPQPASNRSDAEIQTEMERVHTEAKKSLRPNGAYHPKHVKRLNQLVHESDSNRQAANYKKLNG
jgi:hypothetical protein